MSTIDTKTYKYRIGVVANSSSYTYNFRLGLLERLQELGFQVFVIAPKDHFSTKLIACGIGFHHLPLSIYSTNPVKECSIIWELVDVYKNFKLDFVFHYTAKPNVYGSIAAWLCGIPSIAITTGLGVLRDPKARFSKFILKQFYRLVDRVSKEIWFLNQDDWDFFKQHRILTSAKPMLLPSEGVNIRWYKPSSSYQQVDRKPIRFLYAGRIVWSKGIKEFFEAATLMKEKYGRKVHFQMAGFIVPEHPDGVSFELVQKWQKLGVVEYLGEMEDIRPYIEDADCVVLPSYHEGVSRVLMEAASMATPIVASNVMGCKEVVEHGKNGFLCEAKNAKDLFQKMELFYELPLKERQRMGLAGRKKAIQEFDEELIIEYYLKALVRYFPSHLKLLKTTKV